MNDFIDTVDSLSSDLNNLGHPTFILTDSNINLFNLNNNSIAENYLQSLYSNGYLQTILKASRIQNDNSTLIDHIFIN